MLTTPQSTQPSTATPPKTTLWVDTTRWTGAHSETSASRFVFVLYNLSVLCEPLTPYEAVESPLKCGRKRMKFCAPDCTDFGSMYNGARRNGGEFPF